MRYKLEGSVMPAVEVLLNRGESIYTQTGGMCWMSDGISMSTNARGGFIARPGPYVFRGILFHDKLPGGDGRCHGCVFFNRTRRDRPGGLKGIQRILLPERIFSLCGKRSGDKSGIYKEGIFRILWR